MNYVEIMLKFILIIMSGTNFTSVVIYFIQHGATSVIPGIYLIVAFNIVVGILCGLFTLGFQLSYNPISEKTILCVYQWTKVMYFSLFMFAMVTIISIALSSTTVQYEIINQLLFNIMAFYIPLFFYGVVGIVAIVAGRWCPNHFEHIMSQSSNFIDEQTLQYSVF